MVRQIGNEFVKLFRLKAGYVFILLSLGMSLYSISNNNLVTSSRYNDSSERLLLYYFDTFGRTYNDNMVNAVESYYYNVQDKNYKYISDEIIPKEFKTYGINDSDIKHMMKVYYQGYALCKVNNHTDRNVDVRGYNCIITEYKNIDFFMVIITLIITSLVFSMDHERGQEDIVKTTKWGNKSVIFAKIICVSAIVAVLELVRFLCMYISVCRVYDITDLSIPIQNMPYMHDVSVDISIGNVFIFLIVCEIVGMIATNLICGLVITAGGRSASGFFWGISGAYVPFFLFDVDKLYRKILLPSAYIAPYNFLDELGNFKKFYFGMVVVLIALCVITYAVYSSRYKKLPGRRRK